MRETTRGVGGTRAVALVVREAVAWRLVVDAANVGAGERARASRKAAIDMRCEDSEAELPPRGRAAGIGPGGSIGSSIVSSTAGKPYEPGGELTEGRRGAGGVGLGARTWRKAFKLNEESSCWGESGEEGFATAFPAAFGADLLQPKKAVFLAGTGGGGGLGGSLRSFATGRERVEWALLESA